MRKETKDERRRVKQASVKNLVSDPCLSRNIFQNVNIGEVKGIIICTK